MSKTLESFVPHAKYYKVLGIAHYFVEKLSWNFNLQWIKDFIIFKNSYNVDNFLIELLMP